MSVAAAREAVQRNRLRDHEEYNVWQCAERFRDEITDQAERLRAPMANTFEYQFTPNGLATDGGKLILPVLEKSLHATRRHAQLDPDWVFEAARNEIEYDEQLGIESLARSYRENVLISSVSLDLSDYDGMQAIAETLGYELPQIRPSSEDILRSRMWLDYPPGMVALSPIPDAVRLHGVDIGAYDRNREKMMVRVVTVASEGRERHFDLVNLIRSSYDDILAEKFGGEWFGGCNEKMMTVRDAMEFILAQDDLLADHMKIVDEIYDSVRDEAERARLMAPHRYNLAAALYARMNGQAVESLADAGQAAVEQGLEFDGDCPTVPTNPTIAAEQQLAQLGYRVERQPRWSRGQCRNCVRKTQVWKHEDGGCNVCPACSKAHTERGDAGLRTERQKAERERARIKNLGQAAQRAAHKKEFARK